MGKKYKAGLPPEYKISHSGKGNSEVEYAPHLSIPFTSLEQQYLRGVPITTLAGKFGGYSPTIPEGLLVYLSSTMMDINPWGWYGQSREGIEHLHLSNKNNTQYGFNVCFAGSKKCESDRLGCE